MTKNQNKKKQPPAPPVEIETKKEETVQPEITPEVTPDPEQPPAPPVEIETSSSETETTTETEEEKPRDEVIEEEKKNDGTNEPAARNVAEVFDTKPIHEKAPNPKSERRVPGVKAPPVPSGGWHLFIDPMTSGKSVVTSAAKKIIQTEQKHLRYLGPCDEKGKLTQ